MPRIIQLAARPEPLTLVPEETALIVVDMQNAYCSPGGYIDLVGFDVSGAAPVIEETARLIAACRDAGIPVIYLQNGFSPDQREAGGAAAPVWHKSNALKFMRANEAYAGKLITHGTWDHAIVEPLAPEPGTCWCRSRATAASPGPGWSNCWRRGASAPCWWPASPPMSASRAPSGTPTTASSSR